MFEAQERIMHNDIKITKRKKNKYTIFKIEIFSIASIVSFCDWKSFSDTPEIFRWSLNLGSIHKIWLFTIFLENFLHGHSWILSLWYIRLWMPDWIFCLCKCFILTTFYELFALFCYSALMLLIPIASFKQTKKKSIKSNWINDQTNVIKFSSSISSCASTTSAAVEFDQENALRTPLIL